MPRLITRLQGATLRRVQLPSIKEPFLLGCQRRKYNCCVILLDLLKMTELSNWIWIWRGVKDFCPVFLPAAPGDGRQIFVSQYEEQTGIVPAFFSLTCLTNGDFSHTQNQRVFYKKWWEGQSKEGNQILPPFLFSFHLLAQEYYHCPNTSRLLGPHTREHLCNSSVWNEEVFFSFSSD